MAKGKKVTFVVDDATVRALRETAERVGKSQSMVVREAVAEYAARAGQLTESERRKLLDALDRITAQPPTRPQEDVVHEQLAVRQARRQGGRRRLA